jgi:predicted metalloprotease
MRWKPGGRSENIEDRRGEGGFRIGFPGGGGGFTGGGLGCGGLLLILLLSFFFRENLFDMLGVSVGGGPQTSGPQTTGTGDPGLPRPESTAEEPMVEFISWVLDDNQQSWKTMCAPLADQYTDAKLVLFRDVVQSACGFAEGATGPFYCPGDQRVYIDLGFYDELRERFGAPGDFAQAYVIAHELGHHVQNILGIDRQVRRAQQMNPEAANELSVRLELQADCFAGVWGHEAARRGHLEEGDLEEGLNAAAAIGDDRIQRMSRGRVSPESWTHGSSAMRVEWFKRGLTSGRCEDCDTFAGMGL